MLKLKLNLKLNLDLKPKLSLNLHPDLAGTKQSSWTRPERSGGFI